MNKMTTVEGAPKEYTLQPAWLEGGARTGAARPGWVRLHAVSGAAAWTFGYLYLMTAVIAVWAAWNADAALQRFLLLAGGLAGSLLIVYALARTALATDTGQAFRSYAWRLSTLLALIGVVMAGLYIVARLALPTFVFIFDRLPVLRFSDNEVAGAVAILLPYSVALVIMAVRARSILGVLATGLVLLVAAAGLFLTGSRGAWLGVLSGALIALYLTWRFGGRRGIVGFLGDILMLALAIIAIIAWNAVVFNPSFGSALSLLSDGGSAMSRTQLWRDTLPLLRDYWFTGSGLGNSAMVYSTYSLLLHVPYLEHAHNLYLQVALEQGGAGLAALVGMILATLLRAGSSWGAAGHTQKLMLATGFASVVALAVHGLFDAELYVSAVAPILFLSLAALYTTATLAGRSARLRGALLAGYKSDLRWVGVVVALAFSVVVVLVPSGVRKAPAALAANLGAVAQTRAELGIYMDPSKESDLAYSQDAVRRFHATQLAPAAALFEQALERDSTNTTAHRRLALMALATGDRDTARQHLEAAYAAQHIDRLPRQLLGELDALDDKPTEAAAWWQSVDTGQGQLDERARWYEALGDQDAIKSLAAAVAEYRTLETSQ